MPGELTVLQQQSLVIVPKITGLLSLLFSSLIIFTIARDTRKRRKTYHRLLFGISLVDLSTSFWTGLSTWPIPKDAEVLWAYGTETTCTVQGFFTQFSVASPLYNASLSIYYLLVIRYQWSGARIRKIEPLLHAIPVLWGSATAFAGAFLGLYDNANLWCWIAPTGNRAPQKDVYRFAFFYGPLWLMIALSTISLLMIISFVSNLKRKLKAKDAAVNPEPADGNGSTSSAKQDLGMARFSDFKSCGSSSASLHIPPPPPPVTQEQAAVVNNEEPTINDTPEDSNSRDVFRAAANQSYLYVGALYFTWVWLTIVRLVQAVNGRTYFPLLFLAAASTPLQGLPNFLVYIVPRLVRSQRLHPKDGFIRNLKHSFKPDCDERRLGELDLTG